MTLNAISIIVNTLFLVIALVLSVVMLRSGSRFYFHLGNAEVQERMKWLILRSIVILVILGVVAAIFNLIVFSLPATIL